MPDPSDRLPPRDATLAGPVSAPVTISWDTWGVPHVQARTRRDLAFGLGYATAQEHLWRLEYCRRQARGTLAAVLGKGALQSDRTMRLVALGRHADERWQREPEIVVESLLGLAEGINAWRERAIALRLLPVEFEWLGFEPAPWSAADSVAVWKGRWWMLTSRLENVALAEAARRYLPPSLLDAFMATELGEETIVPPELTPWLAAGAGAGRVPGGSDTGEGSNNWAVAGARTTTGFPVFCTDPHNPFTQPSQWFAAQLALEDGSVDAAGMCYIGGPAVYMGRNRHVAWGFTNHVAPQRDLYVEEGVLAPPEVEQIEVRGEAPVSFEVHRTPRGPIANFLVPSVEPEGGHKDPLSLRWFGVDPSTPTGLDAILLVNAARSPAEAIEAMSRWVAPTGNFVVAGQDGHIAYHTVGRVPRRGAARRGFRRASDPADQWDGFIPYESLPHFSDPPRGWIATANQPPWRQDPPGLSYLAGAAWADGGRMKRIRERLEAKDKHSPRELAAIQADTYSIRAAELVPALLSLVDGPAPALDRLRRWDFHYSTDSVAATVWTAFWDHWLRRVAAGRFPQTLAGLVASQAGAVGRSLLLGQDTSPAWFAESSGSSVASEARAALDDARAFLTKHLGPEHSAWRWGTIHTVTWTHAIADSGPEELRARAAETLNIGPFPTHGGPTVRAAGHSAARPYRVPGGATYRLMADLSPDAGQNALLVTNTTGNSGHPASPHYADQATLWLNDEYHPHPILPDPSVELEGTTTITPS